MRKPICNRILSAILAVATMVTLLPMVSLSAPKALESELPDQSQTTAAPSNDLPWDHDTLYITLDGEDMDSLPLYPHEKVEIEASGLVENAAYQWQVEHPEKDDVWVNVYDGTEKTIRVTQALVENVLRADGTARLRCRAYTDSYAYLSNTVTVTVLAEENAAAHTTYAMNREGDVAVMAENSSEFVTVEIHYVKYEYVRHVDDKGKETYVLEEKGEAYGAYVATIRNGSDLSVEVPNPSIVGYEANLVPQAGAEQSDGVVSINLANITTDVSFRVEYRPAEVPYSVHYYFQNIYDDQYVEDNTLAPAVTLFGYTGMHPDVTYTQATFTGFTSLFYEPDIIAGDGSTVFNVYYERNYYLMEFDCNGGYGTDTIYVRYGTYVAVADPVRAGYVFGGWDLISTDNSDKTEILGDGQYNVLPQMLPAYNSGYKAIWNTTATTYTVVYWRENADDDDYSYWGSVQVNAISASLVSGKMHSSAPTTLDDYSHFAYNAVMTITEEAKRDDLVDGKVIVEGDGSTVVNVYYSRNYYTITFKATGICQAHVHGANCLKPFLCGQGDHVHSGECVSTLICTNPQHEAHTAECLTCKETEHIHGDDCCTIEEHTHKETAECCSKEEHTHDRNCLWGYYCSKEQHSHADGNCNTQNCGKTTHIHGDGNCSCDTSEHTHSDENGCYKDAIHTHGDACYTWGCGASAHTHTDECYGDCVYPDHTHTTNCNSSSRTNIVKQITRKYGADISDIWPITDENGKVYDDGQRWDPSDSSTYTEVLVFLKVMPNHDLTLTVDTGGSYNFTMHYYVEVVDGDAYDVTYNGKNFKLAFDPVKARYGHITKNEDFFDIAGYKQWASNPAFSNNQINTKGGNVYFYYERNTHTLKFHNYNEELSYKEEILQFQASLTPYQLSKEVMEQDYYPSTLEPGAYEFGGWYTTPGCYDGTEVDWANDKMPDEPLTLYAKWVPVNHNVYFHLTYEDIATNTYWDTEDQHGNPVSYPIVVEHGAVLGTTYHYMPERNEDHDGDGVNDYIFVGWFYMDEDNKKRFAPDTMEIKRDLHLFAEWQSLIDTQYKVEYVLKDAETINGVAYMAGTTLAVITDGHSTAGRTKTFTAKAGDQLLDAFKNASVFPMTNTHSILMDADPTGNTYRFEYVLDPEVYYKIRYVDKVTGEVLGETGNLKTNNSIVTEKFKYFEGYVPEQFYIRKVLASDGEATTAIPENVITFYYLPNTEENQEALYNVEYYKKNPITGKYEQVQNEPGRGEIDKRVSVPIPKDKFTGYAYTLGEVVTYDSNGNSTTQKFENANAENLTVTSLSRYGLVFRLYYDPVQYPYLIKFVEYGNPTHILGYGQIGDQKVYKLDDVDEIKADYDKNLAYTAPDSITDKNGKKYNFIDNSERTQTLTIRIDDLNEAKVNILTFYYEMEVIPIEYHAVCTVPGIVGGNVSQSSEPKPQNPQGCEAMVLPGFVFEGWFYDDACTQPVTNQAWISGTKITPTVDGIVKGEDGKEHFYALFKPIVTELTIEKTVNIGEDRDDSFLFHVQGVDGTITGGVDLIVAITGNGKAVIKELYCGMYTVTELTGWSWKYDISGTASKSITLVENATNNKVSFSNTYANPDWLGDECCKDNNFN